MKNYSGYDHSHCWESKNPPCGQKIEHLKCCLCQKLNPACHTPVQKEKIKCPCGDCDLYREPSQTSSGESSKICPTCSNIMEKLKDGSWHCRNCRTTLPSPSSESWVEQWENLPPDSTGRSLYPTQKEYIISFIKNTIIPAEVERGRREVVEECIEVASGWSNSEDNCAQLIKALEDLK